MKRNMKRIMKRLFVAFATAAVAFPMMKGNTIFMDKLGEDNNPTVNTKLAYNATKEIIARRAQRIKTCPNRPNLFDRSHYRMERHFVWGVSTGKVPFFACKVPKAASSSMTTVLLVATAETKWGRDWGDKGEPNVITNHMYVYARANMAGIASLPSQKEGMAFDSPFVSLMFVREPMDRLVSAWKDKINRRTHQIGREYEREYYYTHHITSMLLFQGKNFGTNSITVNNMNIITGGGVIDENTCSWDPLEAWDQGCRVSFKDFIRWLADGNEEKDEHWAPVVKLCSVCQAGYDFIGHAEHYNEDIQVAAKLLNIDPSVLPDMSDPKYEQINNHFAAKNPFDKSKKKTTEEMFADVPINTLRTIRSIYLLDYETLSYDMPEWLENA